MHKKSHIYFENSREIIIRRPFVYVSASVLFGLLYFCVKETDDLFEGAEISNEDIFDDAIIVQIEEPEKVDFFILKENIGDKCNLCTEV